MSTLKYNPEDAKSTCQLYLASCDLLETRNGSLNFETAVLGYTLDDQKRISKRLQGLLAYTNDCSNHY